MNSAAKRARGYPRRIASGLSLLVDAPGELPRNLLLAATYAWNVYVRRKRLVVLVREGGLGDLACVLASVPALRDRHPNSWFVLITPRDCLGLALASGLPDAAGEAGGFFHTLVERSCPKASYYQPYLPDEYAPPRPQTLHLADEFAREL